ncbi:tetratricopeptide repeat protein [Candidatus Microgenomates bacterium]|nr:tetratricopeptide repeat protein [Candidatus Microgenomates bacterium]
MRNKIFFLIYSFLLFVTVAGVYMLSNIQDPDMWLHLKAGETIVKHGIVFRDLLSQAGPSREWLPHEWLFQVLYYGYTSLFGLSATSYFVAAFATAQAGMLTYLLRRIFKLSVPVCLLLTSMYMLQNFNLFTPRPQVITFSFLLINLYLILRYVFYKSNRLLLTIPITYVWANMHSSVVLNTILFALFTVSYIVYALVRKNAQSRRMARILAQATVGNLVVSVLPPLLFTPYKYVLLFFKYYDYSKALIVEWKPLTYFMGDLILYTATVLLIGGLSIYVLFKTKERKDIYWLLPCYVFILLGYTALRQTFIGYVFLWVILGWTLSRTVSKPTILIKTVGVSVGVVILLMQGWFLYMRLGTQHIDYPSRAAQFVNQAHIQGHMFNQYTYGSYLSYSLDPEHKVFIDTRADVYLCCEIPDYLKLSAALKTNPVAADVALNKFISKYDLDFFILSMSDDIIGLRTAALLTQKKNWGLVFWDDTSQIFVKRHSGNDAVLTVYNFNAVSPLGTTPYKGTQADAALKEYIQMNHVVPSAVSQNAIGHIYFEKKEYDKAKAAFQAALVISPDSLAPLYNIAEVYILEKNADEAIATYEHILRIDPRQMPAYDKLGQLYLYALKDPSRARDYWQNGLNRSLTSQDRETFSKQLDLLH